MKSLSERTNGVTFKALGIALLALVLLIPLSQLQSLIGERAALQEEAQGRIAAGIGGLQRIGGPVLNVPSETQQMVIDEVTREKKETWIEAAALRILPRTLDISATVVTEQRHKGIYSLPVYTVRLHLSGDFDRRYIEAMLPKSHDALDGHPAERVHAERAYLLLPLGELKSLRRTAKLELAGLPLEAAPGTLAGREALILPFNLTSMLANGTSNTLPFEFDVEVSGSQALEFVPLAATTTVALQSDWPHPNYYGNFLPLPQANGAAKGAPRHWSVLQLNRAIPQGWMGDAIGEPQFTEARFGVRLMETETVYSANERAIRYGILFIAITFLGFFGWEHLASRLRLHPVQYLLVGLALAVFYLVLMALSEHIGFDAAYAAAASALVLLIGVYVSGVSGSRLAGVTVSGVLSASYGLLYVILKSEDYALLLGALLVFATLAGLMLATRRIDWHRVGDRSSGTAD